MLPIRRMEYRHEFVTLSEMTDKLDALAIDGWAVVAVLPVHANTFEFHDNAHILVVLKRPKRFNENAT